MRLAFQAVARFAAPEMLESDGRSISCGYTHSSVKYASTYHQTDIALPTRIDTGGSTSGAHGDWFACFHTTGAKHSIRLLTASKAASLVALPGSSNFVTNCPLEPSLCRILCA